MSLDVHLYGMRIGELLPAGGNDYQLAYITERLTGFSRGGGILSNALPSSEETYSPDASRAYVEGLLPEGRRRRRIAAELGIHPDDGYSLIGALGRDCPGAVTFMPAEERDRAADEGSVAWVAKDELEELTAPEPPRLLDPGREERMRFALPGRRHKLSLAREGPGGPWAWPSHGTPSTHVLKPEGTEHPEMVANEMFCTTVAREAGLLVPRMTVETTAGLPCLVAERFDREVEGTTEPFQQESFCQALALAPASAVSGEEAESPSFAEACGLLRATGEEQSITLLIAGAVCHHLLGNGDAHGANFGLLLAAEGVVLAPFYDIASTAVYGDLTHTGLTLAADPFEPVTMDDLAAIAEECGVSTGHCRNVAGNVAERVSGALPPAIERARAEGWDAALIEGIVDIAAERCLSLAEEVEG
jgi:serine/threonine-protein kinase HipA